MRNRRLRRKCSRAASSDGHSRRRFLVVAAGVTRSIRPMRLTSCSALPWKAPRIGASSRMTVRNSSGRGIELVFDPEVEYRIYRAIPHNLVASRQRLAVPGGFIGGRESTVLARVGLAATRRRLHTQMIDGGHLFPFERPLHAAHAIRAMAATLSGI